MNSDKGDEDYCGIFASDPSSDERSVAIAVRTHKTLELVDDKFYMITCGKAGFQNTRYILSDIDVLIRLIALSFNSRITLEILLF